jgi:hypothetical protein
MPTQRYIALQMLQDRALWELKGPRTRRASTAELRRRVSANSPDTHVGAWSASRHRPAGKLVESTSDLSLLVAYVDSYSTTAYDDDPVKSRETLVDAAAAMAARKSLPEDEEVEDEAETVLTLEEEELVDYRAERPILEGNWQLSKESMFLVSAFLVLFTSGGLILG